MKPARRWLQPPQHGMLSLFLFSLSRIPSFLKVTPAIGEFGVAGFVIIKVPSSYSGRREDQAGRHNTRLGFIGPRVTNRRFEQGQRLHRSIWAGTRDAVSLIESRTPVCWGRQGGRSPERRSSALADVTIPAADVFDKRQTEVRQFAAAGNITYIQRSVGISRATSISSYVVSPVAYAFTHNTHTK